MLVTVLKEHYVVVLAEDQKDIRWFDQVGYDSLGEDYFQQVFKDFDEFIEEVNYLRAYGAVFEESSDEDAPFKVIEDLLEEGFIEK